MFYSVRNYRRIWYLWACTLSRWIIYDFSAIPLVSFSALSKANATVTLCRLADWSPVPVRRIQCERCFSRWRTDKSRYVSDRPRKIYYMNASETFISAKSPIYLNRYIFCFLGVSGVNLILCIKTYIVGIFAKWINKGGFAFLLTRFFLVIILINIQTVS